MENILLEKRELKGKKCNRLLKEGQVPCVIYNIKGDSRMCQLDKGTAERLLKGVTSSTMLDVKYDKKDMKVLVKGVDTDPRNDMLRHISFFELDENVELTFEIPFVLTGEAPAVKNNIGVLIQTTNSVYVKCKSKDLIPQIEVDISKLEDIGDSILVQDLEIPSQITLLNEEEVKEYTIATITELQKQIEEEPSEEEEEEEGDIEEGEAVEGEETEASGDKDEEKDASAES